MKDAVVFKDLLINYYSTTPKYRQLADYIINAISEGLLKENEILINYAL